MTANQKLWGFWAGLAFVLLGTGLTFGASAVLGYFLGLATCGLMGAMFPVTRGER